MAGNVRELANVIEHAMVTSPSPMLDVADLPEPLCSMELSWVPPAEYSIVPLEAAQKHLVTLALKAAGGHQGRSRTNARDRATTVVSACSTIRTPLINPPRHITRLYQSGTWYHFGTDYQYFADCRPSASIVPIKLTL